MRRMRRHVIAGAVGVAVVSGGVTGAVEAFTQPDISTEVAHELEAPGTLDMDKVSTQLGATEYSLAEQNHRKELGLDVVPLSEYTAKPQADKDKLALENSSHATTLPADTQKTFDTVLDSDKTAINYLVKTGQLSKVRFSMATDPTALKDQQDGDMQFIRAHVTKDGQKVPAELAYVLPPTGKVTAKAAAALSRHELTHLVTRPLDIVDKKDEEKPAIPEETYTITSEYAKEIGAIRSAAIAAAEQDPEVRAAAQEMIDVNKGSSDALAQAQTRVAESLLDGTFDTLQPSTERPSKIGNLKVDEARLNPPSFVLSYDRGLTDAQLDAAAPAQQAAKLKVDALFQQAVNTNPASPFAALKESTYLHSSPNDGHPGDNTSELVASTMNVVTAFPQQVAAKLRAMPAKAKHATLNFIKNLSKDTQRVVDTSSDAAELSKQIGDTVDWVEKNAD
jgi:hypothetical protein